ncbi:MAG TPA: MATE family efflux transporter [Candidatus Eubacterium faecipullorum]|uniref:Multidrug export protein MepA n=1 Tax=Candidatus Eubacterium faecipullorum TaxID=2838571 RepID=A0A9D1UGB2_9FIRM|nr:MATE family efflux transporter [Candidatus Eubacterium faecipullorum]
MKKNPVSLYFKYVSLNVLGMAALSCYILADTFFVSRGLGADGLTALNLAIPVFNLVNGTGLMLGVGGGAKYAVSKSRGDSNAQNKVFTNTLFLAAVFSAVFLAAGIFFSKSITAALGADSAVFNMTNTYLKVILLFSPAFILNNIFIAFIRNDGDPKLSMAGMITGSLSNVLLDYIFIFPLDMGIFGAVFATGLSPVISMCVLSMHKIKRKNDFHIVKTPPAPKLGGNICALGIPSLVSELSSGIVIIVFNTIILNIAGNTGVAAYGVVTNISLVVIAVYTGAAQGMQPLVSEAHGRGDGRAELKFFKYAVITVFVICAVIYPVVFFFSEQIAAVFNSENNDRLQQIAVQGLKLYFTGALFAGFNIVAAMFFTARETPLPAHIISILRGLVLIVPAAFILAQLFGITGVWLSFTASEAVCAVCAVVLLTVFTSKKKTKT